MWLFQNLYAKVNWWPGDVTKSIMGGKMVTKNEND
jgi:hypothetical protein